MPCLETPISQNSMQKHQIAVQTTELHSVSYHRAMHKLVMGYFECVVNSTVRPVIQRASRADVCNVLSTIQCTRTEWILG